MYVLIEVYISGRPWPTAITKSNYFGFIFCKKKSSIGKDICFYRLIYMFVLYDAFKLFLESVYICKE